MGLEAKISKKLHSKIATHEIYFLDFSLNFSSKIQNDQKKSCSVEYDEQLPPGRFVETRKIKNLENFDFLDLSRGVTHEHAFRII